MVAIWEYRIVLPFTVEEYKIAQLYMVAKYSASESNADNGDGVEVLKNQPYDDGERRGQYTHKLYHLASKLPSWLVSLMPKKALTLDEEAWNAYPHCTTILTCPFFNKFRLVLKTTHQADRGTDENALALDAKTLKKRQVEYIDIATDTVETYLEDEDPGKFESRRTGRGPLKAGWTESCKPVMCAYKCVTVDMPYYWGFIEKYIAKNAQRKVLLDGHRKCFCWLDEWHGLTMEDIRRMEIETEEAMARVREIALRRGGVTNEIEVVEGEAATVADVEALLDESFQEDAPLTPRGSGTPKLLPTMSKSRSNTPRSVSGSPSLMRRPSLVGPSVAVGIATVSASDLEKFSLGGSTPHPPVSPLGSLSLGEEKAMERDLERDPDLPNSSEHFLRCDSCESFVSIPSHHHDAAAGEGSEQSADEKSDVAQYCVDVLDRAINWTKQRARSSGGSARASGKITPVHGRSSAREDDPEQAEEKDMEHCVGVLSNALSVVKNEKDAESCAERTSNTFTFAKKSPPRMP